ncbi:MAG: transporter [Alistipes sp.]|nr:transporter [Alistipes sp.]
MKLTSHTLKTIAMPLCMVVGAVFCRKIAWVDSMSHGLITPVLIFLMLFFTYCGVDARKMRPSFMHLWLLLFQIVGSVAVYYTLWQWNEVVAQGAMICILTPVAMAAVVIGGMLGANVATMASFSLLCNIVIACIAPSVLYHFGNGECTTAQILQRVVVLLIVPFIVGQFSRVAMPKVAAWVGRHRQMSFYMWLMSLIVIMGRTTNFLLTHEADSRVEITLAAVALVVCLVQFGVGRLIGRRYNDAVAGGQSLGQKNTILAVWLSQAFLDPVSSVAPTAYIVWQNLVNSFQLYRKGQRENS